MTGLSDSGDGRAGGPRDGPMSLALAIADAVEGLTNLWSAAAQGAGLGLSPQQLRALRTLEAEPGLNLTALAVGLDMGLPTASRLCDRLEAAGHIHRDRHPTDRRKVVVTASKRSAEAAHRRVLPLIDGVGDVVASMTAEERLTVGRFLDRMIDIYDGAIVGK